MISKFTSNLAFQLATPYSYERGEEYFKDGAVVKIWKENNQYKAIVKGTRRYNISISTEDDNVNAHCDCPYDLEGICKHIVAAIFALADDAELSLIGNSDVVSKKDNNEIVASRLLSGDNKVQIENFFKKILAENKQARDDFTIFIQGPKETGATVLII